jgi:hypothetical protein
MFIEISADVIQQKNIILRDTKLTCIVKSTQDRHTTRVIKAKGFIQISRRESDRHGTTPPETTCHIDTKLAYMM